MVILKAKFSSNLHIYLFILFILSSVIHIIHIICPNNLNICFNVFLISSTLSSKLTLVFQCTETQAYIGTIIYMEIVDLPAVEGYFLGDFCLYLLSGWQWLWNDFRNFDNIYNSIMKKTDTCIWCLQGWWAMVSGYEFLTYRLQLWQASSEVAALTVVSEVLGVGCFLRTYSAWDLPAAMSSRRLIDSCPA